MDARDGEEMSYKLDVVDHFVLKFNGLPQDQKKLIQLFVGHYREKGLGGWQGKVAKSDNVPEADPDRMIKIWRANRYNLWHAHIGHPTWAPGRNQWVKYDTSDWVVHFQKMSDRHIALLDYDHHNPMTLPSTDILFRR